MIRLEAYEEKYLLVFSSGSHAMLLYNQLINKGCSLELVATPCRLSRGCSQSIVFQASDMRTIIEEIKTNNVIVKGIYKIVEKNNHKNYVAI